MSFLSDRLKAKYGTESAADALRAGLAAGDFKKAYDNPFKQLSANLTNTVVKSVAKKSGFSQNDQAAQAFVNRDDVANVLNPVYNMGAAVLMSAVLGGVGVAAAAPGGIAGVKAGTAALSAKAAVVGAKVKTIAGVVGSAAAVGKKLSGVIGQDIPAAAKELGNESKTSNATLPMLAAAAFLLLRK